MGNGRKRETSTTQNGGGKKAKREAGQRLHTPESSDPEEKNAASAVKSPPKSEQRPQIVPAQDRFMVLASQKHTLQEEAIRPSTSIHQKVSRITSALTDPEQMKTVHLIRSKHKSVSKTITVVEIVKRSLAKQGVVIYQYSQVLGVPPPPPRKEKKQSTEGQSDDEDEDAAYFESMGTGESGSLDERLVPLLHVYLSRHRIEELMELGYDTVF